MISGKFSFINEFNKKEIFTVLFSIAQIRHKLSRGQQTCIRFKRNWRSDGGNFETDLLKYTTIPIPNTDSIDSNPFFPCTRKGAGILNVTSFDIIFLISSCFLFSKNFFPPHGMEISSFSTKAFNLMRLYGSKESMSRPVLRDTWHAILQKRRLSLWYILT